MNEKKQKRNRKTRNERIEEAQKIALYFIDNPSATITDAKRFFKVNDNIIRSRCKLLCKENNKLFTELINSHPEFNGLFIENILPKKEIKKKKEKPEKKITHICIKNASGAMIMDIPDDYKPTSKRKCKSISGKKKVLGHHLFKLAVGNFFDNSIRTFDIKADNPDEAIHIMKCMIDHYKMTYLSKNKIQIITSQINLKQGMKIANKDVLSNAI